MMKSASILAAALVVVVALLGSSASAATTELTVKNDLPQTITVQYEYCPPCTKGFRCTPSCLTPKFTVASGGSGSLSSSTYPLKYLKIQVGAVVYCLTQAELQPLTASAVIEVGPPSEPGVTACSYSTLYVSIVDPSAGIRNYPCLAGCSS